MTRRIGYGCLSFLVLVLLVTCLPPAQGAVVTLKIRAINPSKVEKKKVLIKSFLPRQVKPGDVVSSGELVVSYDVTAKTYAVGKEVELAPAESRTFEVVIRDIWEIPESDLKALAAHAGKLNDALKGSEKADTAAGLKVVIDEGIKSILARQAAASVGSVKPVDHIRAYESNRETLAGIRKDTGVLENLAIIAGKDVDAILGLPKIPPPVDASSSSATGGVMVVHIKITNPSPTTKKKEPLRYEFASEIKTTDIVDPAGLQIGFDTARNLCYAYQEGVELDPQESKVFDVKIRDPWAGLPEKLPRIEKRCRDLLAITKDMESYKAVTVQAETLLKELAALKEEKGPGSGNPGYVVFSRQQAEALHGIDTQVQRLEEIFQPREKPMAHGIPVMDVPRPDKRTTWVLIYIVLAFLGLFSLLFYVRWYGKGKDEKLKTEK